MWRLLTFLMLLVACAPGAQGQGRMLAETIGCSDCPPIHYDLWLRARVIEEISFHVSDPREATGWSEQLAVLIEMGNEVWREIRDQQRELDWYIGTIEPHGSTDGEFVWAADQRLCFVLSDSSRVCSEALIVTSGDARLLGPIRYLNFGLAATFDEITVLFSGRSTCPIYAGFPKGRWDFSDVDSLVVERKSRSVGNTSETDSSAAKEEGP